MSKGLLTYITVILLFATFHQLFGQQKYEKESRVKSGDVPVMAQQFVDSLGVRDKVKWYLEQGLDRQSYEAKFTLRKFKYSIEFDKSGTLEDVEVIRKWKELNTSLKESILDQLCDDCWKINMRRVQVQYTGERQILLNLVKSGESKDDYEMRYEIVIRCRTRESTAEFEYLFTDTGQKLSRSEIVYKNASNLEY